MDEQQRGKDEGLVGPVKDAWIRFFRGMLDPWVILLLVAAAALFGLAQAQKPGMSNALVQLLLAISTGVLGARIANRLGTALEDGVLFARGKVAVRGLKILLRHITALEDRAIIFLKRQDSSSGGLSAARDFEEVVSSCRQLQEQAISSIENWTDIIPEASIATAIGEISAAKSKLDEREAEIESMRVDYEQQVAEAREQNRSLAQTTAQMMDRINEKQKEANELRRALESANYKLLVAETSKLTPLVPAWADLTKPSALAGTIIARPKWAGGGTSESNPPSDGSGGETT